MLNKIGTTENMVEYHENGIKSYEFKTHSDGFIQEATRDKNGYPLTYKNSDGDTALYTRDDQSNELAFNDSDGYYRVKGKQATQEEYKAFIKELEKQQTAMQELIDEIRQEIIKSAQGKNLTNRTGESSDALWFF